MADEIIIPPRRGEFFTVDNEPTHRFITWIESLTNVTNSVSGEVSETSELISNDSGLEDDLDGLGTELALLTPFPEDQIEVVAVSADFTTTGNQIIICTNTAAIDITLNATPSDGEQLHIKKQNTGRVNVIGDIDGDTKKAIVLRYDAPHLVFTVSAGEWSII